LAKIEYDGKKPSTLRYGAFTIAVNSETAAGGTGRVPFANVYPDSQRIRRNPLPNGAIRILPSE
jgi:hypothetical protein